MSLDPRTIEHLRRQVRPKFAATGERLAFRDRDILNALAAYDREGLRAGLDEYGYRGVAGEADERLNRPPRKVVG
jgi:hypothetical protein